MVSKIKKFRTFFGFKLAHFTLRHTDILATKLQKRDLNAAQGYQLAMMTVEILEAEYSEEKIEQFYKSTVEAANEISYLEDPVLPRQRSRPIRVADYLEPIPEYEDVSDMYKALYFEALSTITSNIKQRFQQKGYEMVMSLENLLLKSANGEEYSKEFEKVTQFYGSDLDKNMLEPQLLTYKLLFKNFKEKVTLKDVIETMEKSVTSVLLSEICTVLKLILILPATNSQSERVFSSMKNVKTSVRSSMNQNRLNHIMLMSVHKEETKNMCLEEVADQFIAMNEKRRSDFGVRKN